MRLIRIGLIAAICYGQAPVPARRTPLWTERYVAEIRSRLGSEGTRAQAELELRQHGWDLLELVMSNSRRPDWYYNWCTLHEVFKSVENTCPPSPPRELDFNQKMAVQTAGALPPINTVLSSSYYNPVMVNYFRKQLKDSVWPASDNTGMLESLSLTALGAGGVKASMTALAGFFQKTQGADWKGEMPPIPADAIIVKPAWYRVPCPRNDSDKPAVPAWPGEDDPDFKANGFWTPARASTKLQSISASSMDYAPCQVAASLKNKPDTPGQLRLNDFFYFRSQLGDDFKVVGPLSDALNKGDYLVLVGLHIITREQPDWVWTTFWWDPAPTEIAGRPDWMRQDRKLRHFNMRITVALDDKPVFNPYLEGIQKEGFKSHCVACHRKASVQAEGDWPNVKLTHKVPAPTDRSEYDPMKSIRTSFLWSVAARALFLQ